MLKILDTKQIKELDAYTIGHEPISSIDLMERACRAFVTWFTEKFDRDKKVGVVCGQGNNGGDGLGVARILLEWGYSVQVWVVRGPVSESKDFGVNLNRLKNRIEVSEIVTIDNLSFDGCEILVDALFGSGLSRPVEGIYAQVIQQVNQSNSICVAMDIPSGLMADVPSQGAIVKANYTLSFQLPKLAFLLPGNNVYTGEWAIADIGLKKEFIKRCDVNHFFIQRKDIKKIKKTRKKFDHKGTYGRATLICGSYGKMGAAVLSAKAAMRSGLGLLTMHVPKCGYEIIQISIPEAMVNIDVNQDFFSRIPEVEKMDAIGIGPGIGLHGETVKAFTSLLESYPKPMVIDADALNILAANSHLLHIVPPGSILTPHEKEFERLVGTWKNDFERLEKLKILARNLNAVIVLKGAHSSIASPDGRVFFNSTGNPGMATGGSGDVLTGILTGILAQGYSPLNAALMGVFVHGLAGDFASTEIGMDGLIASDIIDFIPHAFHRL